MPLTNSYNSLAQSNEQPEYQSLWEPLAINPASVTTALTVPTAAFTASWTCGSVLQYGLTGTFQGVGTTPGPGGDPNAGVIAYYTVQEVDLAAVSSTTAMAGILIGVGSLGANPPVAPNSTTLSPGPSLIAMVAKRGIVQVLVDATTTVGHTLEMSTTSAHTGMAKDSGGTTATFGTTFGVALQAVTVSAGPLLCWASVNFA